MAFTAVLDACVLYPAPLRDLLLELGVEGVFHARWTDQIHDEWMSNLHLARPDIPLEALQRTRSMMNHAILDCVVCGHEPLIEKLSLPDPDDRHVLAAAITAKAAHIVTFNGKDFPRKLLAPYGVEARHPDDFLLTHLELSPEGVCRAIKRIRARLRKPKMNVDQYLLNLQQQQLPRFVEALRKIAPDI